MKKALLILVCTTMLIAFVLIIAPRNLRSGVLRQTNGKVTAVYKCGKDVILRLNGFRISFSIQNNSRIDRLRDLLLGKTVVIQYNDCWTPLDPGASKAIADLSIGNRHPLADNP